MRKVNAAAITLCLLGTWPMAASAETNTFGPNNGDRELSISGTGTSDRDINSGSFGLTGDLGWYFEPHMVAGIRQSINYASIESETRDDDFWSGSTRAYINHQFLTERARPFIGASLGANYGESIKDSAFAGLELGLKYYVLMQTYFLGRVEYQFLFSDTSDASDAFKDDGAWAYTVGLGYNF